MHSPGSSQPAVGIKRQRRAHAKVADVLPRLQQQEHIPGCSDDCGAVALSVNEQGLGTAGPGMAHSSLDNMPMLCGLPTQGERLRPRGAAGERSAGVTAHTVGKDKGAPVDA